MTFDQPVRARMRVSETTSVIGTMFRLDGEETVAVFCCDPATFDELLAAGGDGGSLGDVPIEKYPSLASAFKDGWEVSHDA